MSPGASSDQRRTHDVLIVGAGPAGLALALSMAGLGLAVAVIEREEEERIAVPADDGREIALTHGSLRILDALGVVEGWSEAEMSPIRSAQVYNGRSARFLEFRADRSGSAALGYLVSNHCIRRELYRRLREHGGVELRCGRRIVACRAGAGLAVVATGDGEALAAPLLVAADSRFSETRRAMGIPAEMHDFGRSMLVFRARHSRPHAGTAMEWFDFGRTIATLPLHGDCSSIILTVAGEEAARLAAMPQDRFGASVNRWLERRLGRLEVCSAPHRYPLVATYAERFAAPRFALVGDAAVGMHPVTAHGFNFGLSGLRLLADAVAAAVRDGRDIGSDRVLGHYQRAHRRRTWPLYQATNAIARLYTAENGPARMLRRLMLGAAEHIAPIRKTIVRELRS